MKMNDLVIVREFIDTGVVKYKVKDSYTVYMITSNKNVAEYAFKLLNDEYKRNPKNAS